MDKTQIKQELVTACRRAIENWLGSTPGAHAMGANASVFVNDRNAIQVNGRAADTNEPTDFLVTVAED